MILLGDGEILDKQKDGELGTWTKDVPAIPKLEVEIAEWKDKELTYLWKSSRWEESFSQKENVFSGEQTNSIADDLTQYQTPKKNES